MPTIETSQDAYEPVPSIEPEVPTERVAATVDQLDDPTTVAEPAQVPAVTTEHARRLAALSPTFGVSPTEQRPMPLPIRLPWFEP